MKRFDAAASIFFIVGTVALGGCTETAVVHLDPLTIDGRDGGGKPVSYDGVMRLGAAAHAAGDRATAVALYRRAGSLAPGQPAPFDAAGNTLLEMGNFNEAIVAFNSALDRNAHEPEALRGLARAYLKSGKPELAGQPLSVAFQDTPNDPKLLELIGVADDFSGKHEEAQARYRRGLELLPFDPALSLNLAMSLALTGNYPEAIAILRPIAVGPASSPRERQTLAMIYGLQGNRVAAEQMARRDLDPQSAQRNLAYFDSLRQLSPDARARAVQSLSTGSISATGRNVPIDHGG
jgi:Flp pilus assembly protein TadD